jgi:plastocyanin
MKRTSIAVLAIALVTVACGGTETASDTTTAPTTAATDAPSTTEGTPEVAISIAAFAFGPDTVTIPVGTTVTWTNDEDSADHTTTSDDGVWNSATLKPGEQFSFTFDQPGTFNYFCNIHPSMTATIVVEG